MWLIAYVFGIPAAVFYILAVFPHGKPAMVASGAALFVWGGVAFMIYPLSPPSGPDDWFHGIEQFPFWFSLMAILSVFWAQWKQWKRMQNGETSKYGRDLAFAITVPVFAIFIAYALLGVVVR